MEIQQHLLCRLDPTRGGEHVSVTYSGKYEDENGKDTWNSINILIN